MFIYITVNLFLSKAGNYILIYKLDKRDTNAAPILDQFSAIKGGRFIFRDCIQYYSTPPQNTNGLPPVLVKRTITD